MLKIIVLAAGKGTRMQSDLAKVLHPVRSLPMVEWVLRATDRLRPKASQIYVVVGHQSDRVRAALAHRPNLIFVSQREQKGTGHAVLQVKPYLNELDGHCLVLCGDTPLIKTKTLQELVAQH